MSAHAARTPVDTADSTAAAGSALDSIKQGAYEIQTRASEAFPATGRFLGRVVYNTAYTVSFGVTFPVMMVVRVVPKDNALVHGLVDGAAAARDRVDGWRGEAEGDLHDSADEVSRASDNGSVHHDDSSEHATPRRPRAKRTAPRKTTRSASRKKG
jgi:hypothetical protein